MTSFEIISLLYILQTKFSQSKNLQSLQTVKPTEGSIFKGVYFVVIEGPMGSKDWIIIMVLALKKTTTSLQQVDRSQVTKSVLANAFDLVGIHQQQLQRCQTMKHLGWQTADFVHVQNPERKKEIVQLGKSKRTDTYVCGGVGCSNNSIALERQGVSINSVYSE